MPNTSKITFTIIAFYLVVGVYNYSGTGNFITPYFLNYVLIASVAIYSYFANLKSASSHILGLYAVAILFISSSHSLTLSVLNNWINFSNQQTITVPDFYKIIAILLFYIMLTFIHLQIKKVNGLNVWFLLPLVLLIGSLVAVFLNFGSFQAILLSGYLLAFIIVSNAQNTQGTEVHSALVFQFILFFVLENIRLLTTSIN